MNNSSMSLKPLNSCAACTSISSLCFTTAQRLRTIISSSLMKPVEIWRNLNWLSVPYEHAHMNKECATQRKISFSNKKTQETKTNIYIYMIKFLVPKQKSVPNTVEDNANDGSKSTNAARHRRIMSLLKDTFKLQSFRGKQLEIIQSVLDRNDTFVLLRTGDGKSLCYQLVSAFFFHFFLAGNTLTCASHLACRVP